MKYIVILSTILLLFSYNNTFSQQNNNENKNKMTNSTPDVNKDIKIKTFDEIYKQIDPANFRDLLSTLMKHEDHTVITAGTESSFNSMAARWEALGLYFDSPTTLSLLGAQRYTLEFIKKQKTYTLSFLPKQYQGELYAFGKQSGRNSNKMKETKLNYVKTPSGNITYKEAKVVIECQLFEITTVNPNDFYTEDAKKFVENGFKEAKDYHKLVFGKITKMWIQKGSDMDKPKQNAMSGNITDATSGATYSVTPGSSNGQAQHRKWNHSQSFPLILISLTTLATYLFSFLLQKTKFISKLTHRKIWNGILLLSFSASALIGLLLVFTINYHFKLTLFPTFQKLHVNFGIVMAIVSVYHCIWHLDYFKKLFSKPRILA